MNERIYGVMGGLLALSTLALMVGCGAGTSNSEPVSHATERYSFSALGEIVRQSDLAIFGEVISVDDWRTVGGDGQLQLIQVSIDVIQGYGRDAVQEKVIVITEGIPAYDDKWQANGEHVFAFLHQIEEPKEASEFFRPVNKQSVYHVEGNDVGATLGSDEFATRIADMSLQRLRESVEEEFGK